MAYQNPYGALSGFWGNNLPGSSSLLPAQSSSGPTPVASGSRQPRGGSGFVPGADDVEGTSTMAGKVVIDTSVSTQNSVYTPRAAAAAARNASGSVARTTVIRKGGGETWEDPTLLDWDPSHFRLFVGNLGNDVSDDGLKKAFMEWPSFVKAKVVRDKFTTKTKGYGFVAFSDPEDFMKAWKAMNGQHIGSRPVKISKATTKVGAVDIGERKARQLDEDLKNKSGGVGRHRGKVGAGPAGAGAGRKPYVRR